MLIGANEGGCLTSGDMLKYISSFKVIIVSPDTTYKQHDTI